MDDGRCEAMCGRYYIDERAVADIRTTCTAAGRVPSGDIHPGDTALVLSGEGPMEMRWGFPRPNQKGLWVNARAESILDRPAFSESVLRRRCIVLAGGFYEWDRDRQKASFTRKEEPVIFMAGCYRRFEDGNHFVILTTRANDSVRQIHERMPLILEKEELDAWLRENPSLKGLLSKVPPSLERYQEYEQQRLPF